MRTSLDQNSSHWPEVWKSAYQVLGNSIVTTQLRTWIEPLQWKDTDDDEDLVTLTFSAPNDFSAQWVRDHYIKELESALAQVSGKTCKVVLTASDAPLNSIKDLEGTATSQILKTQNSSATNTNQAIGNSDSRSNSTDNAYRDSFNEIFSEPEETIDYPSEPRIEIQSLPREKCLDSRYTFSNFVVGASNEFAHASAIAVSQNPGTKYNPLFIYSPPGLGKTHLLHAIGNHLVEANPKVRVFYASAEMFVNELIDSIQHRGMPRFRKKYRDSYDVLLIDDIQFIAGKGKTEEEFFHTFNTLYAAKRQIILTSDRPPKNIERLEERIRTRFEWGLVADIQPPEIETRIAILKAKAEQDDIYLPDDVSTFLATRVKNNVRALEGILVRLQAQASLTGAEISLEMAVHELKTTLPEESSNLTSEAIQKIVATHYGIKVSDLKSSTRQQPIALARQVAMYLIRKYTAAGFKEIGRFFGGKDHSTIVHGFNKIETAMENDLKIRESVEAIQNQL